MCVLLAFLHGTTQEAYVITNTQHADYPGYCYTHDRYSNETFMLKVGTKKRRARNCYSIECATDYRLIVLGCGVQGSSDHCRVIPGDLIVLQSDGQTVVHPVVGFLRTTALIKGCLGRIRKKVGAPLGRLTWHMGVL
ncbi:hypothetical protein CBL_12869 [Carabus blaptoides fortunei]